MNQSPPPWSQQPGSPYPQQNYPYAYGNDEHYRPPPQQRAPRRGLAWGLGIGGAVVAGAIGFGAAWLIFGGEDDVDAARADAGHACTILRDLPEIDVDTLGGLDTDPNIHRVYAVTMLTEAASVADGAYQPLYDAAGPIQQSQFNFDFDGMNVAIADGVTECDQLGL